MNKCCFIQLRPAKQNKNKKIETFEKKRCTKENIHISSRIGPMNRKIEMIEIYLIIRKLPKLIDGEAIFRENN